MHEARERILGFVWWQIFHHHTVKSSLSVVCLLVTQKQSWSCNFEPRWERCYSWHPTSYVTHAEPWTSIWQGRNIISPDISVTKVTGCGQKTKIRFRERTDSGVHPLRFFPMGALLLSPEAKRPDFDIDHSNPSPMLRTCGSLTPLHSTSSLYVT
jgi:hypothetical protein